MLPVKQSILIELSYIVLSDDRLPNAIKTLLQSRILLLKIINRRLVNTGHSLFNLQHLDFISLLSLSLSHNWSGNTLLFSGALLDLHVPSSMVIIFLGLGWFLLRVSLLRSTLLSLLVGPPSRYITTLVIIVILVLVAPTGPGSNSWLVLSLLGWVWQHPSCTLHVPNNYRVNWGAHTHHPAVPFVVRGNPRKCLPTAHLLKYGPPSAASLNCLVSPSRRELKPYPQSSVYSLCLKVPSLAVHSTSLHLRISDYHYSGHGKQHYIPHCHRWSILRYHSSSNLSWIWFPRRESLFTVLI